MDETFQVATYADITETGIMDRWLSRTVLARVRSTVLLGKQLPARIDYS